MIFRRVRAVDAGNRHAVAVVAGNTEVKTVRAHGIGRGEPGKNRAENQAQADEKSRRRENQFFCAAFDHRRIPESQ